MSWFADLLWELGRKGAKHQRKRARGDEDHWYPLVPKLHDLVANQCNWCKKILPGKPKRGCRANLPADER